MIRCRGGVWSWGYGGHEGNALSAGLQTRKPRRVSYSAEKQLQLRAPFDNTFLQERLWAKCLFTIIRMALTRSLGSSSSTQSERLRGFRSSSVMVSTGGAPSVAILSSNVVSVVGSISVLGLQGFT